MGDPLPPDPYAALGVAKDATAGAIKTQYRKLVLKCHPDKIQDETEKANASDKFHKIQTAWEIIGDEARRARYDAQCKLQELREDVMHRAGVVPRGAPDVKTAGYKFSTESARGGDFYARGPDRYGPRISPQYEERRPSYVQEDYFDERPRPTSRKHDEYDRSTKRAPLREEREKPRAAARETKENRKDKSRRTDKDMRKDRDRKAAYSTVEIDDESDSDPYERSRRRMREEDDLRRARDQYYASADRQREEAENGLYVDERAKKMFSQGTDAREYIAQTTRVPRSRPESEPRRPSPVRMSSSKDKINFKTGTGEIPSGRKPAFTRSKTSTPKTKTSSRDTGKSSKSDEERKKRHPSIEIVEERPTPIVRDEPREAKRPPTLNQSKSSPADIRPPFVRQRSHSLQEEHPHEDPMPHFKRADTMPQSPTAAAPPRRKESSRLRAEDAYVTPEPTPEPEARKYNYGQQYADDMEYPTPDGYRTEVREPAAAQPAPRQRFTRSPSPLKESRRERRPTSSKQQPPPMPRTTSRTYVYADPPQGDSYPRPPVSRENSGRGDSRLYGEIPVSRSPRQQGYMYSPPPEKLNVQPKLRHEDIKYQTGYSRRSSDKGYRSGQQPVHVK